MDFCANKFPAAGALLPCVDPKLNPVPGVLVPPPPPNKPPPDDADVDPNCGFCAFPLEAPPKRPELGAEVAGVAEDPNKLVPDPPVEDVAPPNEAVPEEAVPPNIPPPDGALEVVEFPNRPPNPLFSAPDVVAPPNAPNGDAAAPPLDAGAEELGVPKLHVGFWFMIAVRMSSRGFLQPVKALQRHQ